VAPPRDLLESDVTPFLRQRVKGFFEQQSEEQGVDYFMHKFTGWPRARFLKEIFPQARFLHIVRDGRAVANSMLQQPWWSGYRGPSGWGFGPLSPQDGEEFERSGRRFEVLAAIQWRLLMREFSASEQAATSGSWLTLRYEDLVASPEETTDRIVDFADLPDDPQFADQLHAIEFSGARRASYYDDLAPDGLQLMEQLLGPTLEEYGYAL
jgi:hypothetical protein